MPCFGAYNINRLSSFSSSSNFCMRRFAVTVQACFSISQAHQLLNVMMRAVMAASSCKISGRVSSSLTNIRAAGMRQCHREPESVAPTISESDRRRLITVARSRYSCALLDTGHLSLAKPEAQCRVLVERNAASANNLLSLMAREDFRPALTHPQKSYCDRKRTPR